MATKRKADYAKVTAWTPDIKMDFDGSIGACTLTLFDLIPAEQRPLIFKLITINHEKYLKEGR